MRRVLAVNVSRQKKSLNLHQALKTTTQAKTHKIEHTNSRANVTKFTLIMKKLKYLISLLSFTCFKQRAGESAEK